MFDNLHGTPLGGLTAPVLSSQGNSSTALAGREISSDKFDKSLIVNSYGSVVAGRNQRLSSESDGAVEPADLLAQGIQGLQEIVDSVLNALPAKLAGPFAAGSEVPLGGKQLPEVDLTEAASYVSLVDQLAEVSGLLEDHLKALGLDASQLGLVNQKLIALQNTLQANIAGAELVTKPVTLGSLNSLQSPLGDQLLTAMESISKDMLAGENRAEARAMNAPLSVSALRSLMAEVKQLLQQASAESGSSINNMALPDGRSSPSLVTNGALQSALPPAPNATISAALSALAMLGVNSASGAAGDLSNPFGASGALQNIPSAGSASISSGLAGAPQFAGAAIYNPNAGQFGLGSLSASSLTATAGLSRSELARPSISSLASLNPLAGDPSNSLAGLQGAVAADGARANSSLATGTPTFMTNVGLPVATEQWGSQIAQRMTWLSGQGINSADIQLNPPELGPMQVRIDSSENSARVTISVHNAAIREALEAQLPRLRDMFASQGLDLVDVDVDSRDYTEGEFQSTQDEADAQSSNAGDNSLTTRDEESAADEQPQRIVLSYALVDAYA
jgi:flagellar hook-length control protein FliK